MKKIYLVCSICEDGKYYAYAETISTGNNLLPLLQRTKGLHIAHISESRTQAEYTATHWNACYKANGTYLFDSPSF